MKIGSRWLLGETPPSALGTGIVAAIAEEESELRSLGLEPGSDQATGWAWTLTYLEGSPVVTLSDGTTIREHPDGVLVTRDDD